MSQPGVKKRKQRTFLRKLLSKLACKPEPPAIKKQYPGRRFNIAARVINLNEVNDDGTPTGELRFIREARYSESQAQWLYQLNGKNFKNNAGWVTEDGLRKYHEPVEGK